VLGLLSNSTLAVNCTISKSVLILNVNLETGIASLFLPVSLVLAKQLQEINQAPVLGMRTGCVASTEFSKFPFVIAHWMTLLFSRVTTAVLKSHWHLTVISCQFTDSWIHWWQQQFKCSDSFSWIKTHCWNGRLCFPCRCDWSSSYSAPRSTALGFHFWPILRRTSGHGRAKLAASLVACGTLYTQQTSVFTSKPAIIALLMVGDEYRINVERRTRKYWFLWCMQSRKACCRGIYIALVQ